MDNVQRRERVRGIFNEAGPFQDFRDYVNIHWEYLCSGDRSAQRELSRAIRRLNPEQLIGNTNSDYRFDQGVSFHWQTLVEDGGLRAGLLYLPGGGLMPAHDHPDTIGFIQVLSGKPEIIQSNLEENYSSSRRQLIPGDMSLTFPIHNNIHGFENGSAPALVLSVNVKQKYSASTTRKWRYSLHTINKLIGQAPRATRGVIALSFLSLAPVAAGANCALSAAQTEIEHQNYANAASLLEDCAKEGLSIAQCKLGDLYYTGKGVEQDYYTAAQWYRKAAEQGDTQAQYLYGLMLVEGLGVTDDAVEGLDWIFKAMRAGHVEAKQTFEYLLANPAPLDC